MFEVNVLQQYIHVDLMYRHWPLRAAPALVTLAHSSGTGAPGPVAAIPTV